MILAHGKRVEVSGETIRKVLWVGAEPGGKSLFSVPALLPGMRMQCAEAQQLSCGHEDNVYTLSMAARGAALGPS